MAAKSRIMKQNVDEVDSDSTDRHTESDDDLDAIQIVPDNSQRKLAVSLPPGFLESMKSIEITIPAERITPNTPVTFTIFPNPKNTKITCDESLQIKINDLPATSSTVQKEYKPTSCDTGHTCICGPHTEERLTPQQKKALALKRIFGKRLEKERQARQDKE